MKMILMNFKFQDISWVGIEGYKVGGGSSLWLFRTITTLQMLKVKKTREFLLYSHEFMQKLQHSKTHEKN